MTICFHLTGGSRWQCRKTFFSWESTQSRWQSNSFLRIRSDSDSQNLNLLFHEWNEMWNFELKLTRFPKRKIFYYICGRALRRLNTLSSSSSKFFCTASFVSFICLMCNFVIGHKLNLWWVMKFRQTPIFTSVLKHRNKRLYPACWSVWFEIQWR